MWTSKMPLMLSLSTKLRPTQNGHHLPDDSFKWIFINENIWISSKISLKFVPWVPINRITALVQIMAWCRPGHKPLSEWMMVNLMMHICVTRPQWVKHAFIQSQTRVYKSFHLWGLWYFLTKIDHIRIFKHFKKTHNDFNSIQRILSQSIS